jgi:transcriptional regulator with XRE-family HTH domain
VTGAAARIREFRNRAGLSEVEVRSALGMSDMEYYDLEAYDDELDMVPSLAQVKQLALTLGVTPPELVSGAKLEPDARIEYSELVGKVVEYCRVAGITRAEFEDLVGWKLEDLFAGEESMLANYPVDFLKHVCEPLQVQWVRALP